MQKGLDTYITNHHQLVSKNLFEEKVLALLVELGELANETRCFKFWSTKTKSNKNVILEEYVDNIHFLLSIGLEKGYAFAQITTPNNQLDETKTFNDVFKKVLHFYEKQTEKAYVQMFQAYVGLAQLLGFTESDIIKAYHEKNEVNYARQQNGY
jgi:dimeric dUTPase (all-alpha-NTP-PPase superfamily)